MGEYAIRKSDGEEIKIGTCETMYYVRYEDRDKVAPLPGNVDLKDAHKYGLRFRLPIFAEDGVKPGDYQGVGDSLPLFHKETKKPFPIEGAKPGRVYVTHEESGIQVSFPCYHGGRLPTNSGEGDDLVRFKVMNQCSPSELAYLKAVRMFDADAVLPVVRCCHCREEWRVKWEDVWSYIEPAYRARLAEYTLFVGDDEEARQAEAID
jgi:hypothetical protein